MAGNQAGWLLVRPTSSPAIARSVHELARNRDRCLGDNIVMRHSSRLAHELRAPRLCRYTGRTRKLALRELGLQPGLGYDRLVVNTLWRLDGRACKSPAWHHLRLPRAEPLLHAWYVLKHHV